MRRSFTLFSVVFHAIAISAALIVQVLAVGALPTPHQPILFDAASITAIEVHVPPPPHRKAPAESPSASFDGAPIVAPDQIIDETGRENLSAPAATGLVSGVESGPPSSTIDGIGVAAVAPPPPPEPVQPVHVGSGIRTPVKIVDVPPVYPTIARSAHVQGVVILEALLDAQGRVASVRVLRSVPLLDQAAIDAVQQWRYTPTQLNGRAVPVIMTVTVNFMLQDR